MKYLHEKCILFGLKKLFPNKTEHRKAEQTQQFKKFAKGNMGSSTSLELCRYLP